MNYTILQDEAGLGAQSKSFFCIYKNYYRLSLDYLLLKSTHTYVIIDKCRLCRYQTRFLTYVHLARVYHLYKKLAQSRFQRCLWD